MYKREEEQSKLRMKERNANAGKEGSWRGGEEGDTREVTVG